MPARTTYLTIRDQSHDVNFANYLSRGARDAPEQTALTDPGREVTFAELDAETSALADVLAGLDVAPGDRVAIYLPNSVAFVASYFGAMKLGAIPFPINLRFQGDEIEYVLEDAGAEAVITSGAFEGRSPTSTRRGSATSSWPTAAGAATTDRSSPTATRIAAYTRARRTNWPTSCTPRGRPGVRRGSNTPTAT